MGLALSTSLVALLAAPLDAQLGHPAFVAGAGVMHPVKRLNQIGPDARLTTALGIQLGIHIPASNQRFGGQIDVLLAPGTSLEVSRGTACGVGGCGTRSDPGVRLTFVGTSVWIRPTPASPFRIMAGTGFVARQTSGDDCACIDDGTIDPWQGYAHTHTAGAVRLAVAWAPKRTGAFEIVAANTIARMEQLRTQHYLSATVNYHLRVSPDH